MNLQEVQAAEQDLLRFAAAFRSAQDLASAIKAAKGVIVGINEYEKKLAVLKETFESAMDELADVKNEASKAKLETQNAKADLARVKAEMANLAAKFFGSK